MPKGFFFNTQVYEYANPSNTGVERGEFYFLAWKLGPSLPVPFMKNPHILSSLRTLTQTSFPRSLFGTSGASSVLGLCLILFSSLAVSAADITVTNANESSLRAAILQAMPGDRILVNLTAPIISTNELGYVTNYHTTILLTTGELLINKDLSIIGVGATNGTNFPTISGQLLSRVFKVQSGTVALRNLRINDGCASNAVPPQGAAIYNRATLTLSNCSLINNQAMTLLGVNSSGGGIFNQGTLTAQKSGFTNNLTTAHGGAIFNSGTARVDTCSFAWNYAGWQGGAIDNTGTLTLENSTFTQNYALSSGGGGLGNQFSGVACITDCKFYLNTNNYYGGGAIINFARLFVTNSAFAGNVSERDSGVSGTSGGGALFNNGFANLAGCIIGPTNAARRGGGILNYNSLTSAPALLVMNACTFTRNSASMFGGGLMNWSSGGPATSSLTNCTISQNYVEFQDYTGGGIDNSGYLGPATVNLMNCTVASNLIDWITGNGIAHAMFSGVFGGDPSAQAEIRLANTMICGTNDHYQALAYGGGKLTSLGNNLVSDFTTRYTTTNASDIRGKNPQLFPLWAAGPILVHVPRGNSPAIDKGNPTNFAACDARGYRRPFGRGSDIGAVEIALEFLNFGTNNLTAKGTNVIFAFTPYIFPTNYYIEYSTNLSPGSWKVLATRFLTETLFRTTNVYTFTHTFGGPAIPTNKAYFYRVRVP